MVSITLDIDKNTVIFVIIITEEGNLHFFYRPWRRFTCLDFAIILSILAINA